MSSSPNVAVAEGGDPVERMIRANGCWDEHVALGDCVGEEGDWRKCQKQVEKLRECMGKAMAQQKRRTEWQKQQNE